MNIENHQMVSCDSMLFNFSLHHCILECYPQSQMFLTACSLASGLLLEVVASL